MSPRAIVEEAVRKGIGLIAVTDHNTDAMTDVVAEAAAERGVEFLYGIELQTREEVHLLAYFDEAEASHRFAASVYPLLPDRANEPEHFGDQVVVDIDEEIVGREPKLLVNSLDLGFNEAVSLVRAHGGLPVPAHVSREPFGLIAQLGLPPAGISFDLIETDDGELPEGFGFAAALCSSDAHMPDQIGHRTTTFEMEEVSIEEMILAARGIGGRSVSCATEERRAM
jgi:PHP family Zn ribbon phosphoesterase